MMLIKVIYKSNESGAERILGRQAIHNWVTISVKIRSFFYPTPSHDGRSQYNSTAIRYLAGPLGKWHHCHKFSIGLCSWKLITQLVRPYHREVCLIDFKNNIYPEFSWNSSPTTWCTYLKQHLQCEAISN